MTRQWLALENGFQYLPLISVEFSSQKIGVCNNINTIVVGYWKIQTLFYKAGLHDIWMAETKAQAEKGFDRFVRDFSVKYPKATGVLFMDRAALLRFYDFRLSTGRIAERPTRLSRPLPRFCFAALSGRHRTIRTKNCVSRNTLLGLAFQSALTAERSWLKLRGFNRLPDVGARDNVSGWGSGFIMKRTIMNINSRISPPNSNCPYTGFDYISEVIKHYLKKH